MITTQVFHKYWLLGRNYDLCILHNHDLLNHNNDLHILQFPSLNIPTRNARHNKRQIW